MNWKPISTAPKDRSALLLFDGHERMIGFYVDDGWYADDWNQDCCGCDCAEIRPTHWAELPLEPPKEEIK